MELFGCRYKTDTEGLYHLETVRYECLETTQEMINDPSQSQHTVVFVSQEGNTDVPGSTPVFIAYETLDSEGKVVSQLVGGQTLNVPVVQTISAEHLMQPLDPMMQSLPVVIIQDNEPSSSTAM